MQHQIRDTLVYQSLMSDLFNYGECYWKVTDNEDEFSIQRFDNSLIYNRYEV